MSARPSSRRREAIPEMVQGTRMEAVQIPTRGLARGGCRGRSGLIHSPTGTGKTYAVSIPPLIEWLSENPKPATWPKAVPLRVLWITPLRALANDTAQSILAPITGSRPARGPSSCAPATPRPRRAPDSASVSRASSSPRPRACRCCFPIPARGKKWNRCAPSSWMNGTSCSAPSGAFRRNFVWRACGLGFRI